MADSVKPTSRGSRDEVDSTPIIVGAGQLTEKDNAPLEAHPPMGLAAEAAKAALADTGVGARLTSLIDTLAVVRIFRDSNWADAFARVLP